MDERERTIKKGHRPKILLVSPLPPPEGGIASWTQRILASEAMKEEALYHLDTSLRGGHDSLRDPLPIKVVAALTLVLKFVWLCIKVRPGVVHITAGGFGEYSNAEGYRGIFAGYYRDMLSIFFARLLRIKVLLNLRLGDMELFLEGVPRLLKPLVRYSFRTCWCVVPITLSTAKLMRRLKCERVEVIPNCIDVQPDSREVRCVRERNGLKVLYVGWVIPEKGVVELLRAIKKVDGATLTIVGPPIASHSDGLVIHDLIEELDLCERVDLRGRVETEATRRTYREHDVFVLPSYREGFPNVVLEAMEASMPVVATPVGAVPEILRDSVDGFLIDVGDDEALADRLNWLKEHPDEGVRMGRSARERVVSLYSVENVASRWVDLYHRAARGD